MVIIAQAITETLSTASDSAAAGITAFDNQLALFFGLCMFGAAILLFFIPAPYGKFNNTLSLSFLTTKVNFFTNIEQIDGRMGFFFQELPSVYVPFIVLFYYNVQINRLSAIFLILWQVHYIQRTFVYSLIRMKSGNKTTLIICLSAFSFTWVNGYLVTKFILFQEYPEFTFFTTLRWIIGFACWAFGFAGNIWADEILLNLRDKKDHEAEEKKYYIPHGCLYELISCPNYACEIVEWLGMYLMFPNRALLVFVFNTCFNLVPRAFKTHEWYLNKFGDKYPKQRKAIIPYVF